MPALTPIVRRVVAGVGANAFGQVINVVIQVLSLPLFLQRWDLATYGTWLILSAIPSYLSMADVGMVTVAGNEMTMAMGRGDVARANTLFQSTLALMTLICAGLAVVMPLILFLLPLPGIASFDESIALLALAWGVIAALYAGLADIVFKSTHRFATGIMLGNLTRLAEWGGAIAGLLLIGTFTAVAVGALALRAVGTALAITIARCDEGKAIKWGFAQAYRREIVSMIKPAGSFMVFPLSSALSLQGVTLLVGHLFGSALVAVFNTYRTVARVTVQATSIFSISLWPEFSRLYGLGGATLVAPIYRRSFVWGTWIAVGFSVVLYPATPMLLRLWTHGKIAFDPVMMGLLLAYAAVGGVWHVPRVLLMSTNLHGRLAQWTLLSSAVVLLAADLSGLVFGLPGVGTAMLMAEILVAAACVFLAQRATQNYGHAAVGVHP